VRVGLLISFTKDIVFSASKNLNSDLNHTCRNTQL